MAPAVRPMRPVRVGLGRPVCVDVRVAGRDVALLFAAAGISVARLGMLLPTFGSAVVMPVRGVLLLSMAGLPGMGRSRFVPLVVMAVQGVLIVSFVLGVGRAVAPRLLALLTRWDVGMGLAGPAGGEVSTVPDGAAAR